MRRMVSKEDHGEEDGEQGGLWARRFRGEEDRGGEDCDRGVSKKDSGEEDDEQGESLARRMVAKRIVSKRLRGEEDRGQKQGRA